jgi:hypothetical protein
MFLCITLMGLINIENILSSQLSMLRNGDDAKEVQLNSVIVPQNNKTGKAQIIMDIEATADGFYRRLEEEEEDA